MAWLHIAKRTPHHKMSSFSQRRSHPTTWPRATAYIKHGGITHRSSPSDQAGGANGAVANQRLQENKKSRQLIGNLMTKAPLTVEVLVGDALQKIIVSVGLAIFWPLQNPRALAAEIPLNLLRLKMDLIISTRIAFDKAKLRRVELRKQIISFLSNTGVKLNGTDQSHWFPFLKEFFKVEREKIKNPDLWLLEFI